MGSGDNKVISQGLGRVVHAFTRCQRHSARPHDRGDGGFRPDPAGLSLVESQIQPASLDLRLGDIAYRVRASFLPGPGATVAERIEELKLHEIDLSDGACWRPTASISCRCWRAWALPPEIVGRGQPEELDRTA